MRELAAKACVAPLHLAHQLAPAFCRDGDNETTAVRIVNDSLDESAGCERGDETRDGLRLEALAPGKFARCHRALAV
jgi:hypothetical protein